MYIRISDLRWDLALLNTVIENYKYILHIYLEIPLSTHLFYHVNNNYSNKAFKICDKSVDKLSGTRNLCYNEMYYQILSWQRKQEYCGPNWV